jgi:LmbE family N-acetylglucosaminyl deacetylase
MKDFFSGRRPLRLDILDLPKSWRLCVLAPHPDDFDTVGMTLRHFANRGHDIRLLVLSLSPNGVEDSFCDPPTPEAKAALREKEQKASCRFFGLPEDRLEFLRLPIGEPSGFLVDSDDGYAILKERLGRLSADIALLPHGYDTNSDHRLTYTWWTRLAAELPRPRTAWLARDPKTIDMCDDAFMPFDDIAARWKAELLRFHGSQHQRNLATRGHGFDERILEVNRTSARRMGIAEPYAETFELEFY